MLAATVPEPGGPDAIVIAEVPDPEPGPGELLIRVAAAGVNRADLLQRAGHYPPPAGASPYLGLEVSGTIAALGRGVDGWRPGEPCVALLSGGGYAEYVAVPVGQVVRPPDGIDLISAAGLIEVAATVVSNLDRVGLAPGEVLLVHGGAGGVGAFAIQYASQLGARVLCTAGSPEKLDFCRSLGADAAIDYHHDWPERVRAVTDGRGVDVILDNMGAKYLTDNLAVLAPDGRLVVVGMQGGVRASLDLGALMAKRASLSATGLRGRPVEQKSAICARLAEDVWPLYSSGVLQLPPTRRFALGDAAQAHRALDEHRHRGKVVLLVN